MKGSVDGQAVGRPGCAAVRIEEGVVGRWHACGVEAHQIGDDGADPPPLVVKHDRHTTIATDAKFERSVRILVVERQPLEPTFVFDMQITMLEKDNMGRVLPRHLLTHRAMTGVAIDRVGIGFEAVTSIVVLRHAKRPYFLASVLFALAIKRDLPQVNPSLALL